MADPYSTLGVARTASEAEIKSAYRKLAKELHPDRNKDNPKAAERFSEVTNAYDLLSDKDKRARFDRGEIDADGNPANPFAGMGGGGMGGGRGGFNPGGQRGFRAEDFQGFGGGEEVDLGDIFDGLFGGGRQVQSARKHRHVRPCPLEVSEDGINPPLQGGGESLEFVDALEGTRKPLAELRGEPLDLCRPCCECSRSELVVQRLSVSGLCGDSGQFGLQAGGDFSQPRQLCLPALPHVDGPQLAATPVGASSSSARLR